MRTTTRALARRFSAILLCAVILLWAVTTPQPWWATPSAALVNAGSLIGLVGTALLLQSVWLTSRYPRLEQEVGLGLMLAWHRRLASLGLLLITAHVALTVTGYARREGRPVLPQTWDLVVTWPHMLAAAAGLVLLWVVAATSIRRARRRLRYESWWAVHLYSYLALGISLTHQVTSGAAFGVEGWDSTLAGSALDPQLREALALASRVIWVGAFVITLTFVLWYRLLLPAYRSLRHDLRVSEVLPVGPGVVRIALTGRRMQRLGLVGGQFAQFRFGVSGLRWQAHPYSFSGLPDRARFYVTVGGGGDHARALAQVPLGTRVFFEGPYGVMTAAAVRDRPGGARRVLIIVGGLGITPVCSLLRDLPVEAEPVIIYRVRDQGGALYLDELRRLAAERSGDVHVLAGSRDVHPLSAQRVEEWVPDLSQRHVYVCGSRGFVQQASSAVRDLGVPPERLTIEAFAW